nr:peptide deformylase [Candidatus Buchananbacteria bacterium]
MAIKSTTQVGNAIIRARSKRVVDWRSKQTKQVIQDLIDSMRHHGLVGMAAPQVGKNVRIFVTEIRKTKFRTSEVVNGELRIYINPTII